MVKVKIHCPECGKHGFIEVLENLVKESQRGITAVNVGEFLVCKHSFIVYIDKNFSVRDSFISDFKVELPKIVLKQAKNSELDELLDKIDPYLIIINLNALTFASIIRGLFNKKKILLIHDIDIIGDHLSNMILYIFSDRFKVDFKFGNKDFYKKNKKLFQDYIVIKNSKIINDINKVINQKKIKIERSIIQQFLSEGDLISNLILLKNEVEKVYVLSKELIKLNENYSEKKQLTTKIIIDYFINSRGIKIQKEYIDFLIDIIKNYFEVRLYMGSDASNFISY